MTIEHSNIDIDAGATAGTAGLGRARTPYHEFGEAGAPRIPGWAQHRSVYRAAGRTLYQVGTDRFDAARDDLAALAGRGWEIRVDREGPAASITLSRAAA
ncbi:hypothetical protein J4H92_14165 [Leucobacter weissii]|uniref:Uncharacterized protein n=1 Tax=Leucobacter weissii TaxID=1983706 RepID=A0A939SD52_9MICO|nr:hypothetical protein [Leucobacter weissii]MBO1903085.1 hypothetical protein [Leucobacter weissii]